MRSVSSEDDDDSDHRSEQFRSYSLSADVSESESSSTFSCESVMPSNSLTYSSLSGPEFDSTYEAPAPPQILSPVVGCERVVIQSEKPETTQLSEIELMKERFAKLLLGEDMSGGGKGVCTALAISNAITNLYATVFGEIWKLEPLAPQKKSMWLREMDWFLGISNSIVELIPSLQESPGGGNVEVMVTRPRRDLYVNLPALKKLDGMLLSILDGFCGSEFHYVERGIVVDGGEHIEAHPWSPSSTRRSIRLEEKWWLPFPKVPSNGLSEDTRKKLQQLRECTIQIFKAAVAINSGVLSEMEIPNVYLDSLPKSVKACLGEALYHYITADQFSPDCLLEFLEISSEYTTLEIANRIEASVHIWRHKCYKRNLKRAKSGRLWGGKVKGLVSETGKSKVLEQRAETLLQNLKLQFPGLPQTALEIHKIQYNKDVGQSILESYSRVIESLAFNLMARIDDLQYVDDTTKLRATEKSQPMLGHRD